MNDWLSEDLWWLPSSVPRETLSIGVAHAAPISDDADVGPFCRSLGRDGAASIDEKLYDLSFVATWRARWKNQNVFSTLHLYDNRTAQPVYIGPFVVDIDSELAAGPRGLADAAAVTLATFDELVALGAGGHEIRVIFSGRKGFNLEVQPEVIGLSSGTAPESAALWRVVTNGLTERLRRTFGCEAVTANWITDQGTAIDHFLDAQPPHALKPHHQHLRLVASENVWIDGSGRPRSNIKRRISIDELRLPGFVAALCGT